MELQGRAIKAIASEFQGPPLLCHTPSSAMALQSMAPAAHVASVPAYWQERLLSRNSKEGLGSDKTRGWGSLLIYLYEFCPGGLQALMSTWPIEKRLNAGREEMGC